MIDKLRFQVTKGKSVGNPKIQYARFCAGVSHCMFIWAFSAALRIWRLWSWGKASPEVTSSHKLPFCGYFQLNFSLHANNYIAICHRTLLAFTHERICLRSGINFGHRRARYTCNQVKYWWLMTSHVVNSGCSSNKVNCSLGAFKIIFLQNWHLKLNLKEG